MADKHTVDAKSITQSHSHVKDELLDKATQSKNNYSEK